MSLAQYEAKLEFGPFVREGARLGDVSVREAIEGRDRA